MAAHRDLDVVGLEVGQRRELAVDELLDGLRGGVPCRHCVAVKVLAKDAGVDRTKAVILDELEAANRGQIIELQARLHEDGEWLGVRLGLSRPEVGETDLDFPHQSRLL